MRVICVSTTTDVAPNVSPSELPIVGNEYTVVDTIRRRQWVHYKLEEMPNDVLYCSVLFAPTSEIDETEMERNYQKETV